MSDQQNNSYQSIKSEPKENYQRYSTIYKCINKNMQQTTKLMSGKVLRVRPWKWSKVESETPELTSGRDWNCGLPEVRERKSLYRTGKSETCSLPLHHYEPPASWSNPGGFTRHGLWGSMGTKNPKMLNVTPVISKCWDSYTVIFPKHVLRSYFTVRAPHIVHKVVRNWYLTAVFMTQL